MKEHVKKTNEFFKFVYTKPIKHIAASPIYIPYVLNMNNNNAETTDEMRVREEKFMIRFYFTLPITVPLFSASLAIGGSLAILTALIHILALLGAKVGDSFASPDEEVLSVGI